MPKNTDGRQGITQQRVWQRSERRSLGCVRQLPAPGSCREDMLRPKVSCQGEQQRNAPERPHLPCINGRSRCTRSVRRRKFNETQSRVARTGGSVAWPGKIAHRTVARAADEGRLDDMTAYDSGVCNAQGWWLTLLKHPLVLSMLGWHFRPGKRTQVNTLAPNACQRLRAIAGSADRASHCTSRDNHVDLSCRAPAAELPQMLFRGDASPCGASFPSPIGPETRCRC